VASFEHAEILYGLGLQPTDSLRGIESLIDRFGGNHTPHLTIADGGELRSHRLPLDPRYLGANVMRVLRTRGPEAARALYRELAPAVDDDPLFRIYEGELELWLGEYEAAARIFRAALAPSERVLWAWIGLGASAMLQGDLREAQEIWDKGLRVMGFAGPTLYVYRGECYRRQGEVELARRELETAVQSSPQRLSAWINLALLDGGAEALERAERQCAAFAPILMEELDGAPSERLEKVLLAMRGNRRSSPMHITYFLWDRLWHGATP
jgi:tetratricopeptide (TPR) repeat protein